MPSRRVPLTTRQKLERAILLAKLNDEVELLMPKMPFRQTTYACQICGAAVTDRIKHLAWHRQGNSIYDVLVTVFGRSN